MYNYFACSMHGRAYECSTRVSLSLFIGQKKIEIRVKLTRIISFLVIYTWYVSCRMFKQRERESNVTKSVINVILLRLYFRYERSLVSGQSINRVYESDALKKKKKKRAAYLCTFCSFSIILTSSFLKTISDLSAIHWLSKLLTNNFNPGTTCK